MRVHLLHENPDWLPPFATAFDQARLPWTEWFLSDGAFDLAAPPPKGVFYNRMSASSHTRGHRYAPELTSAVLAWLTRWGRRVVNGPGALDLEISKVRQYAALEHYGVTTPRTVVVAGRGKIVSAARQHFADRPFILKPNRGGKGLGVQLFQGVASLASFVESDDAEPPIDGLWLLQEYVRAPQPIITRAEFVGGRFLYAAEVDASAGFELCPADVCVVPETSRGTAPREKFTIIAGIPDGLKKRLEQFMAGTGIEIAGVEFITDPDGQVVAYDVNTNTNYNAAAEAAAGIAGTARSGPGAVAAFLAAELERLSAAQ